MNTPPDYYALLGVSPNASTDDIKKAYRTLIARHHPDRSASDSQHIFLLNEAYETLKDPQKRAHYDRVYAFYAQSPTLPPWQLLAEQFGKLMKHAKQQFHEQKIKGASRLFQEFGEQFSPQLPKLTISLDTAYQGGEHIFTYQSQKIKAKLPKGLYPKAKIKLSLNNKSVWFIIDIETSDDIVLNHKDVYKTVSVYPWQIALGETITFVHQGETLKIALPKMYDTKLPYAIPNKGIPAYKMDEKAGTLYIHFVITLPNAPLTDQQKAAFLALKESFLTV